MEIATGENGSLVTSTWECNPVSDRWAQKTNFEATGRTGASAFSINNQAFVLTGRNSTLVMDNAFQFLPDANRVDND